MAYIGQDKKAKIAAALKAAKVPATLKYSLAVNHHSTLVLTIRQASISVLDDYIGVQTAEKRSDFQCDIDHAKAIYAQFEGGNYSVNEFHMDKAFRGKTLKMLQKIMDTIKTAGEWYDKSDSMTDHFNIAFYITIQFGSYDKPCTYVGTRRPKIEETTLSKALTTIMTPGFGESAPVAETPVVEEPKSNVFALPVKQQRSDAEIAEIACAALVRRFVEAMRMTVVGGAFSDQALDVLATAAVGVVMKEAKS